MSEPTTTTTTPTTTTTTTTKSPISSIRTIFYENINGQFQEIERTDAGDTESTLNTPFAAAFNFGTIAPGETSKTIIVNLHVLYVQAITNIKLGLIDAGNLTLQNDTFGITNSALLKSNIIPTSYFQGINTNGTSSNAYNISIPNLDNKKSNYVYLNVTLPRSNVIGTGVIRFQWFLDYSS